MKETPKKLFTAFVGESQARNRYTIWSGIAKKEGYVHVAQVFLEIADQEKTHGGWFYKMLQECKEEEDMKVLPEADFHTTLGTTKENLTSAKAGEDMEWKTLYPDIADTAEKEGYPDIAARVKAIMVAEKHHSEKYGKLLKLVGDDIFFKRGKKIVWICLECGYEVEMDELPEDFKCPSCDHARAYFTKKSEDY